MVLGSLKCHSALHWVSGQMGCYSNIGKILRYFSHPFHSLEVGTLICVQGPKLQSGKSESWVLIVLLPMLLGLIVII